VEQHWPAATGEYTRLAVAEVAGYGHLFLERVGLVAMRSRKREIGNLKPRVVSVPYAILPPRPGQRRRIHLPVRGAGYDLAILSKSIRLS
jgi:hypothetical protein